jgi:hypothetical protein
MFRNILAATAVLCACATTAEARSHHHHRHGYISIIALITPGARTPGAGGSCAGKWEAIRVLHSISRGRGPYG